MLLLGFGPELAPRTDLSGASTWGAFLLCWLHGENNSAGWIRVAGVELVDVSA
jgi:hypothetical protein